MRTNGRKIFYIAVALVAIGLLVGCEPAPTFTAILPATGKTELSISIHGDPSSRYNTLFTVQGDSIQVGSKNDIDWIYDRADAEAEYAIVEYRGQNLYYIHLHLRTSKKPSASK